MIDPTGAQVRNDARAREEAARLAAYQQAHLDRPVTLLGYSAGCWFAVLTAERMPEGTALERVILMSAAIEKSYDLTKALNHTKYGIVHFWSPKDQFTRDISAEFNMGDSTKGDPAASFGFDLQDDRLTQIEWDPAWEQYGYYGEHSDYLILPGWIEQFVAPWVQPSPLVEAPAAASAKP
jgi:pimeloyl-ACP methyl ester carboxylesterase